MHRSCCILPNGMCVRWTYWTRCTEDLFFPTFFLRNAETKECSTKSRAENFFQFVTSWIKSRDRMVKHLLFKGNKLVKCFNRSHQLSKISFIQFTSLIALNSFVTFFTALQVILGSHGVFYV